MMDVILWKDNDVETAVRLHFVGEAVVLEQTGSDPTIKSHYFHIDSQAIEFIIKSASALLSLGYEVCYD